MIVNFANSSCLMDLVSVKAGYPIRGRIEHVKGSGVRAVRLKDIIDNEVDWAACIETELNGRSTPQWLEVGDVLFAAHGSDNTATYVDKSIESLHDDALLRVVATPMFFVLKVQGSNLLPEFLAWFINSLPGQRYFQQLAQGTLTKSVKRQELENFPVAVPPIEQQKKIVALAKNIAMQKKCLLEIEMTNQQTLNAIAQKLTASEDQ